MIEYMYTTSNNNTPLLKQEQNNFQSLLFMTAINSKRIPSWGEQGTLNRQIIEKLNSLVTQLNTVKWTFGREQEFYLKPNHDTDPNLLCQQKIEHLMPIFAQRLSEEGISESIQKSMISTFCQMPLQEVFMTDLHLQLKPILEPRFGRGIKGYYDPQGVFEVSTRPVDPITDVINSYIFYQKLDLLAYEYGYLIEYNKRDITFKAIDTLTGHSIFQSHDMQDTDSRGMHMADGILRIIYDCMPCFMKSTQISAYNGSIDMGGGRHNILRSMNDRLEIRTNHNPRMGSHTALENMLVLTGAYYGMLNHIHLMQETSAVACAHTRNTIFSSPNNKLFFLQELLNATDINTQGFLERPHVSLVKKYHSFLRKELALKTDADLFSWMSRINVTDQAIEWPNAEDISTNPEHLRHCLKKIKYGSTVCPLTSRGYQINVASDNQHRLSESLHRMNECIILRAELSEHFRTGLVEAFSRSYNIALNPTRPAPALAADIIKEAAPN